MAVVVVGNESLRLDELVAVARDPATLERAAQTAERMRASEAWVTDAVAGRLPDDPHAPTDPIYSINTGFGSCRLGGLSVAHTLRAATHGSARALGRADRIGSLVPGAQADLIVLGVARHEDIAYRLGRNAVTTVVKDGVVVEERAVGTGHGLARAESPPPTWIAAPS